MVANGTPSYLLATLSQPMRVAAVRISVLTSGTAKVAYVNAIGTAP